MMRIDKLVVLAILASAFFLTSLVDPATERLGALVVILYGAVTKEVRQDIVKAESFIKLWLVLTALTACICYFFTFGGNDAPDLLVDSAFKSYLFYVVVVVFAFALRSMIRISARQVAAALSIVIVVHAASMLLQTIVLIKTGKYLDLSIYVLGEESRYQIAAQLDPFFPYRPTGWYAEPSNFSGHISTLLIGYLLICRREAIKPRAVAIYPAICCIFITQATAGVIQGCILLVGLILFSGKRTRLAMLLLGVSVSVGLSGVIVDYFLAFSFKFDSTYSIRQDLVDFIYSHRHGYDLLFGNGPFAVESALWWLSSDGKVASLNDAGLINFFVVQFGLTGLLIPVALFVKMKKTVVNMLFFGVLMTSKLSYLHCALYFGLVPLLMRRRQDRWDEKERSGSHLVFAYPPGSLRSQGRRTLRNGASMRSAKPAK